MVRPNNLLLLSGAVVALLAGALAVPVTASAQSAVDTERCTDAVDIEWLDVEFDVDDPDPDKSNWFVGAARTTSEAQCAEVAQTLVLLDGDRTVLFSGSVVLDAQGTGLFEGIDVRVEDLEAVEVLLSDSGPSLPGTDVLGGDVPRTEVLPRQIVAAPPAAPSIGSLPVTGFDIAVLVAVGALLGALGYAFRRAGTRRRAGAP